MKKEAYLKNAHMDKSMRVIIKEGILSGKSLNEIAKQINKDPTTVSKEVKRNRTKLENNKRDFLSQRNICETFCKNYSTCKLTKMCSRLDCLKTCKNCIKKAPMFECPNFIETPCQRLMRFPYVCNGCQKIRICLRTRYTYNPDNAYKTYQETLKESRSKLQINEEQYDQMDYLLNEGVKRGLSPYVVMLEYPNKFPYSIQRVYQLIREGKLMTIPLDLTRAVRRKMRTSNKTKENKGPNFKSKIDDINRTFSDYVRWTLINNVSVFQMDSVIGRRDESVALLTLIHVKTSFVIIRYLKKHNREEVIKELNKIEHLLGIKKFQALFGCILTDRGQEFVDFENMELSIENTGEIRTRIFYCDAQASNQKGLIEDMHATLRRIIPKGESILNYVKNQSDANEIASKLNSLVRKMLGGFTSYDMFVEFCKEDETVRALGIKKIAYKDLNFKPTKK